jgi:hypothetical protein
LISEAACARADVNLGEVDQRELAFEREDERILAKVLRASAG